MQINRNNYEEFFLLYVDNELSAAEKNAVDVFVQQNPDLQEELLMLQQAVAKPDAVIFNDKQSLISSDGIPAGLQEKLLLYLDKEADKNDAAFVEQLINTDDAVKKEWHILQQTKLDTAPVVFKDKHLLYKKESGKVVGIRWWRAAAAALLIGFGIWGAVTYSTRNNNIVDFADSQSVKESNKTNEATTSKQIQPAVTTNNSVAVTVNKDKQDKQAADNIKPQNKKQQATITEEKNIAVNRKESNEEQPQPIRLEKLNNIESNKNDIAAVTPEKQENNSVKEISNLPEVNERSIPKNEFAVAASFPDGSDNGGDGIDGGENKKGRSKLGAFFKKIKRTIERKTNTENSDNSIKVANLSFAVQ